MANFLNKHYQHIREPMIPLETTIIQLFQKGITMAEISELIEKMYGHHYTPQTISNIDEPGVWRCFSF